MPPSPPATKRASPAGERERPLGCAQEVVRPLVPFWLRSYPVPLKVSAGGQAGEEGGRDRERWVWAKRRAEDAR